MSVRWVVARHEVVEVAALYGIFFEGEVFVGSQVINLELQTEIADQRAY